MSFPTTCAMRFGGRLLLQAAGCIVLTPAAWCQDGVSEEAALNGNNAQIVVTVRDISGSPIDVPAIVRLFRSGGIPSGQTSTSKGGRAIFLPQNLGDFSVMVEAAGYKTGHGDVSVPVPIKAEVDVYMEPEAGPGAIPSPGGAVLAPKAKLTLEKGLDALRANKLDDAEKYLREAMRLAPGHPDVLYLQGVLDLRREKWKDAESVLAKATQIDPNHARALAALGTALCNQGKYDAAIAPLEKSLELSAGSWETHWTLAKAYYYHKQYEAALKASQQALLESGGKAPGIELLVAQSLTAVGRYEDSAQILRAFLKNHGDHPEVATARRWLERLEGAGKVKRE